MAPSRTLSKSRSPAHIKTIFPPASSSTLSNSQLRRKNALRSFFGVEIPTPRTSLSALLPSSTASSPSSSSAGSIAQLRINKARRRFIGIVIPTQRTSPSPIATPAPHTPAPNATSNSRLANPITPHSPRPPPNSSLHLSIPRRSTRKPLSVVICRPLKLKAATKSAMKKSCAAKGSPGAPDLRAAARVAKKRKNRARNGRNARLRPMRPVDLRVLSLMSGEWCMKQLRKSLVVIEGQVVPSGPAACWETFSSRARVDFGDVVLDRSNLHRRFHEVPGFAGSRWSDLQDEFDRVKYRWQKIGRKEKGSRVTLYHIAARLNPNIDSSLFVFAHGPQHSNDHSHLCHNSHCIKPEHLTVEPIQVNQDRKTAGCKSWSDEVSDRGQVLERGCQCGHLPSCVSQVTVKE